MLGGNAQTRRDYHTLDGLRGVAALCIVILHTPHFFGWWNLPSSFLSVDLFFCLSGFVLANAYEIRFKAGLSISGFLWIRLVRLYPLYLLGTLLGLPVALLSLKFAGSGLTVPWTRDLLAVSLPLSLFMLPTPDINGSQAIYPFNPVLWSIFFEVIVNLLYVSFWRLFANIYALLATIVIAAAALMAYGAYYGTLDTGFEWDNLLGGLFRVCFSFFLGVLIYRIYQTYKPRYTRSSISLSLVICILFIFLVPKNIIFELCAILFLLPTIVAASSMVEPGAALKSVFSVIGVASYAVYTVHKPLYQLLLGGMKFVLPFPPEQLAPWIGIIYVPALLVLCLCIDRFYDAPLRKILGKWTFRAGPKQRPASATEVPTPAQR